MTGRKSVLWSPWLVVLAGGIVMGSGLGFRHVQGLFLQPITLEYGWTREAFGITLAMQNLIWGLAQPFTGMIADRYGSLKVLLGGMLLYGLGLYLVAYSATPGTFMLSNGLIIGLALSGTTFGAVFGALSRIFPPERRSWALGVAGALGGLGQFMMVPFVQGVMDGWGWVSALVVMAAVSILLAPVVIFLRDDRDTGARKEEIRNQTMMEAIREAGTHKGFWLLNIGFLACGFQLAFIGVHLPSYLIDKGFGLREAGIALALISLANILGTYLCGYLGGFMRRKYLLAWVYAIRTVAMLLFVLLPISEVTIYGYAFVMGLVWLGTAPLTNGLVSQIFGVRYVTTLFGIVFFGHQLGSFFGVWLGGYVFDMTRSYELVWFVAIALGAMATILHLPINDANIGQQAKPVPKPA